MKTMLLITILLMLCFTVKAQKKMTDSEFEGLKGQVKSALTEYIEVETPKGKTKKTQRIKESKYLFEKNGRLTQIIYPDANEKLIFTLIDGNKTFKRYEIRKEDKNIDSDSVLMEGEKPIEEPEKLVPPDKRFDEKYTYEFDSQNRVTIEREYENNGRLSEKSEFKYDDSGRLVKEVVIDTVAITEFIYKYDQKGNLIEELQNRNIKGPGTDSKSRTVYSDYLLDNLGNWKQRTSTSYYEEFGKQVSHVTIYYRTIVYY